MLKNIFKNFVKSTLVVFLALILSNFLPAVIQNNQAPVNHTQQNFTLLEISHATNTANPTATQPSTSTTSASTPTTPTSTSTSATGSLVPTEAQEILQLLSQGNPAQALKKAKEKIEDILPITEALKTISYPLFIVIGSLLDNQIFSSPVMKEVLGNVWAQVRNLCLYILVIYFVFIAIYNVFTGSSDSQYSLKKGIKEIVVAVILIQLSWYGALLTLDVSNVAINITYSWATQYENTQNSVKLSDTIDKICNNTPLTNQPICSGDAEYRKAFNSFLGTVDQRSLPLTLAVRFGRVAELDQLGNSVTNSPGDAFGIVAIFFVRIFIFIIQFFSYLMLAYYLVIRIIYIWIYIALSPIIVLDKVMSGLSIDASEHFTKFFDYALIGPIKGGVGFTLSYMILDSISRTPSSFGSNEVLNSVALSIGSLDSFQSLLVYFASVAVIYEITLNMADGSAAAGAFTWLRGKVQGTGKFIGSAAANTGVFLGRKETNARQFASKFFPDESSFNSSNQGNGGNGGNGRNPGNPSNPAPITTTDTPAAIITKLRGGASITNADHILNTGVLNALKANSVDLTPQQVINLGTQGNVRTALTSAFSRLNGSNAFKNQKSAVDAVIQNLQNPAS